jgi:serine phosphatase RsbU (regulator of sigma subunit)
MIRLSGKYILLTAALLFITGASAQKISANGRFTGKHFSVIDYGSNAQIWTGVLGNDGIAYFGNSQDILAFNGIEWSKISVERKRTPVKIQNIVNQSKVRTMARTSDNQILVGREENFGYISYSALGLAEYVPLYTAKENESFGSIWNIFEINNQEVLFIGENCYFRYKDKQVEKVALPAGFNGFTGKTSCRFGNGILLTYHDTPPEGENRTEKFLFIDIMTGKAREIQLPEHVELKNIRGSFEINGTWYLLDINGNFFSARERNGNFTWNDPGAVIFPELAGMAPNYISRYKNHIYYGTEDHGLIMADLSGHIVRTFDDYDELENLYVNFFFHDAEDNLWLCLDNGIQFIETSSPITYFKKKEGVSSLPEAIDFNGDEWIVGLHTGLYSFRKANTHADFIPKKGLRQFIFDVETFTTSQGKKTVIIGNDGLYAYNYARDTAEAISPVYAYSFRQDPAQKDVIYLTLENGIGKITLQPDGEWRYQDIITGLSGSTFSLVVHNNKIYFGITNVGVGVYNIRTKKHRVIKDNFRKVSSVKQAENLNEQINYYVELFQGRIYVGAQRLVYIDASDRKFNLFEDNQRFFSRGKNGFHRLINFDDKQLWIVNYVEEAGRNGDFVTGWLEKTNGKWDFVEWPLGGLKKTGVISSIQKSPAGEIWLGANSGLYVINFDVLKTYRKPLSLSIDRFEVNEKIVRYNLSRARSLDPLSYAENSFKVVFHANSFSGMGNMEYRYKLEGFNDQWSEWSNLNFASFQKISEGSYTIKIQARNPYGVVSNIYSYDVTVLPPWYRTIWAYLLYLVALIALILLIIQLSTQRVKRQNQRLEATVVERTSEIAEQNKQLEQQKAEITQKTTDILDSIQYAKRIQTTILPAASRLGELFHEHFVFYRPKDIVSGDFYWAREVQGKTIFSAIDCTGHGVPGSLVSIVGNNGLLRAVNEFKLTEPHEILDKLREIVVNAFRSEGQSDVKDGMDIALCTIDENGLLKYAGANNECVIIRDGELVELKPDKQPIGQFVDAKPFTQKEFQLQDNDCVYLYTDGYVDQFGGDKLKKFKSRPFKTMLISLSHMPMREQFDAIQHAFDSWKADLDQVDDVCVFGIRYKKK